MAHGSSKEYRRWRPQLCAVVLLCGLTACSGDTTTDPGGGVEPGPGEPRILETIALPLDAAHPPLQDRIDWSANDRWLFFAAGPGSAIYQVDVEGHSLPVPVADAADGNWLDADYSPVALQDGRVAFFHGWYLGDTRYHILVADPNGGDTGTVITVLHRFSSELVGLAAGQMSSPQGFDLSADGRRAIGIWRKAYLLDWPVADGDAEPTVRLLTGVTAAGGLALTRDGERLAHVDDHGNLVVTSLNNAAAPVTVGEGTLPSWSGDGHRLAYLDGTGRIVVFTPEENRRIILSPVTAGRVVQLALSWSGDRIALLLKAVDHFELRVGTIVSLPQQDPR